MSKLYNVIEAVVAGVGVGVLAICYYKLGFERGRMVQENIMLHEELYKLEKNSTNYIDEKCNQQPTDLKLIRKTQSLIANQLKLVDNYLINTMRKLNLIEQNTKALLEKTLAVSQKELKQDHQADVQNAVDAVEEMNVAPMQPPMQTSVQETYDLVTQRESKQNLNTLAILSSAMDVQTMQATETTQPMQTIPVENTYNTDEINAQPTMMMAHNGNNAF